MIVNEKADEFLVLPNLELTFSLTGILCAASFSFFVLTHLKFVNVFHLGACVFSYSNHVFLLFILLFTPVSFVCFYFYVF